MLTDDPGHDFAGVNPDASLQVFSELNSNLMHGIDQPIVAADIVEFNPRCDISNLTALVAAKLAKEIGGMMLKTAD